MRAARMLGRAVLTALPPRRPLRRMDTVSARASPPERPRALPRPQMQRLPRVAACWLLQCTQCHTLYARSHQHRSCAGRRPAQATQLPEALTAGQLSERAERVHALRWVPAVVCCNRAAPRLVGRAASPRGPAPPRGLTPPRAAPGTWSRSTRRWRRAWWPSWTRWSCWSRLSARTRARWSGPTWAA